MHPSRFLLIQTAFIGDAILATALLEKLTRHYPNARIDLLIRKGNESLFFQHPHITKLLIWDKKRKYSSWWQMLLEVRRTRYDVVVNVQRFASMGLLTVFSGAKQTVGFSSNPLAFAFSKRVKHILSEGLHETDRNQKLIEHLTDSIALRPALYPPKETMAEVAAYKQAPYICLAPASVWFTKQLPEHIWSDLIRSLPESIHVYLIGAPSDKEKCERLASVAPNRTTSLAGKLSLLSSAALLQDAVMCFVNDSAPLHIASAMNTPTCAIYCSTVPAFGFGPLSDVQVIVQTTLDLKCRPCGLHGHNKCPLEHFSCGNSIHIQQLLAALRKVYPMTETD